VFFSELQPTRLVARKSQNGTVLSAEKKAVLKDIIDMNIDLQFQAFVCVSMLAHRATDTWRVSVTNALKPSVPILTRGAWPLKKLPKGPHTHAWEPKWSHVDPNMWACKLEIFRFR
jgi:hypothetical protein